MSHAVSTRILFLRGFQAEAQITLIEAFSDDATYSTIFLIAMRLMPSLLWREESASKMLCCRFLLEASKTAYRSVVVRRIPE